MSSGSSWVWCAMENQRKTMESVESVSLIAIRDPECLEILYNVVGDK